IDVAGLAGAKRSIWIRRGAGIIVVVVRVLDVEGDDRQAGFEHLRRVSEALRGRRIEAWETVIGRGRGVGDRIPVQIEYVGMTVVDRRRDIFVAVEGEEAVVATRLVLEHVRLGVFRT